MFLSFKKLLFFSNVWNKIECEEEWREKIGNWSAHERKGKKRKINEWKIERNGKKE